MLEGGKTWVTYKNDHMHDTATLHETRSQIAGTLTSVRGAFESLWVDETDGVDVKSHGTWQSTVVPAPRMRTPSVAMVK